MTEKNQYHKCHTDYKKANKIVKKTFMSHRYLGAWRLSKLLRIGYTFMIAQNGFGSLNDPLSGILDFYFLFQSYMTYLYHGFNWYRRENTIIISVSRAGT
jgi:hypothetical protein